MLILGIDDAGRGPVIGPMVIAGVLIEKEIEKEFIKLGIKDSKELSPKKREQLANEIKKLSKSVETIIISVDEIDNKTGDKLNLNEREALASAIIINKINKSMKFLTDIKVIIDCPSVNIKSWQEYLEKFIIAKSNIHITCEHKADANYVVVSAASIIAKVLRDSEIKKIKEKYKIEFGSGYSADPQTKKFIHENYNKFKDKGIFRESWDTIKILKSSKAQRKLFSLFP
ncbi:MAG: ribonuclease HII [Candidatus Pacearchaeota archaeon]